MAARGGESQRRVRETMIAAGGYWRPLAAVARLLEELGELSEHLDRPTRDGAERGRAEANDRLHADGLAGELADLWIITTALADQFLADVPEPGSLATAGAGPEDSASGAPAETSEHGVGTEGAASAALADVPARDATAEGPAGVVALLAAAGAIARVVNHYDGPKVPREGEPMPSLHAAVAGFQGALGALAAARGVELRAAVAAKLDRIRARGDIERFGRESFDPSTAPVLDTIAASELARLLPQRLWGAPQPRGEATAAARAAAARPSLTVFAKAARAERLDGFVLAGPTLIPSAAGRAAWLGALLAELDPSAGAERLEIAGAPLRGSLFFAADEQRVYALLTPASA